MAKRDLTTETLLSWDEYRGKPAEQALPGIYARAIETSKTICGWYWSSIRTKRRTSLFIRFVTFVLLIAGATAPIIAGLSDDAHSRLESTQCGVIAAAIAGLLQVADRVFGWSSGWIRYVTTVTAMENATSTFELDWAGYILAQNGVITDADVKPLFDIAKTLEDGLRKLQAEETDKWAVEFNNGAVLLGDLIREQRETGERNIAAARQALAKATATGAVEITFTTPATAITIQVDDEPPTPFTGHIWARKDLSPGQHKILIQPGNIQKIAEIPPAGVARLQLAL